MPKRGVLESEKCCRSFKNNSKLPKVFQQALNKTFIEPDVLASSLLAHLQTFSFS